MNLCAVIVAGLKGCRVWGGKIMSAWTRMGVFGNASAFIVTSLSCSGRVASRGL